MADLATINADIDALDSENNTQAAKIAEAMSLLDGKASGGVEIDDTLTISGAAADARAAGDRISAVETELVGVAAAADALNEVIG